MADFRILLALDESEGARKAIEYVANLIRLGLACEVTLFHVPKTPASLSRYGASKDRREERKLEDLLSSDAKREMQDILRHAEDDLLAPAENALRTVGGSVSVRRQLGLEFQANIGQAIVDEANQGDYGAVVLGRRRQSTLADMVLGSVSSKVVHHVQRTAVWLIES